MKNVFINLSELLEDVAFKSIFNKLHSQVGLAKNAHEALLDLSRIKHLNDLFEEHYRARSDSVKTSDPIHSSLLAALQGYAVVTLAKVIERCGGVKELDLDQTVLTCVSKIVRHRHTKIAHHDHKEAIGWITVNLLLGKNLESRLFFVEHYNRWNSTAKLHSDLKDVVEPLRKALYIRRNKKYQYILEQAKQNQMFRRFLARKFQIEPLDVCELCRGEASSQAFFERFTPDLSVPLFVSEVIDLPDVLENSADKG